ncbi:MAG: hypothetical protein ACRBCI_11775 [Cellvibrionaceae bacterium]
MKLDPITITNVLLANGVIAWLGLWLVKRVDKLDERLEKHETRLSVAEKEIEYVQKDK